MEVHLAMPDEIHDKSLYIRGSEARHIHRALRHKPGDQLTFTDGAGRYLDAVIDRLDQDGVHAEIREIRVDPREQGAPWSTLGIALLKGDHFEIAIEKAVELGVHRIVPLAADHCVVKLRGKRDRAVTRKLERWQRIADSAMKQSGRSWRCEIVEPVPVEAAVECYGQGATVVVADEVETGEQFRGLEAGQPHLGLVGPEGAFSEREKVWLRENGVRGVSLGPFRLRAETAAIVLAAILNQGRNHE